VVDDRGGRAKFKPRSESNELARAADARQIYSDRIDAISLTLSDS